MNTLVDEVGFSIDAFVMALIGTKPATIEEQSAMKRI
jgi:hypothetical protein